MRLRSVIPAFSLLLFSAPLVAQPLRIGPEHAIARSVTAEAFLGQSTPAVATDGHDFFVAWTDYRSGSYLADVYGARVSAAGEVVDDGGIPLASTYASEFTPGVVWERGSYLVAYDMYRPNAPGNFVMASRVGSDGAILERNVTLASTAGYTAPALATSGSRTLLGATFGDGTTRITLAWNGEPPSWTLLPHRLGALVAATDAYVAVGVEDGTGNVKASLVSGFCEILQTQSIATYPPGATRSISAASSGGEVLIAIASDQSLSLFLRRGASQFEPIGDIAAANASVTVAWDGSSFVVAWAVTGDGSEVRATRVSSDGVVDPVPLVVGRTTKRIASVASAGANGRTLVTWSEGTGEMIDCRGSGIFGAVLTPATTPQRIAISRTPPPQRNASLAPHRDGYFVAWQEFVDNATSPWDRGLSGPLYVNYLDRAGRASGDPLRITEADVDSAAIATASSSRGEIVLWKTGYAGLDGVVVHDGAIRPLELPETRALSRPAIIEDANGFAIAYAAYSTLPYWQGTVLARLTPDLTPAGTPVPVGNGSQPPAMAVDGDALIVVTGIVFPGCQVTCPAPPPPEIRMSRVTSAGTLIRDVVLSEEYAETSMACGPVCLVAWWANDGLAYRIASKDLTSITPRALLPGATPAETPRVAWDGGRFVITWSQATGDVREVRVATMTTSGVASEATVVATSRDNMYEWVYSPDPQPLVAGDGGGSTLLMYGRYDDSAEGGSVPRLFARTLEKLGRSRAIRK